MWRRQILVAIACLAGLALNVYLWKPFFPNFLERGNNDFACTYTGAVLAGSPGLYDVAAVKRTQFHLGDSPQFMMYQRFPYYAAFVSPLRRLSYLSAYRAWQGVSFLAFLVFLLFWPGQPRWLKLIACCWSLPLANCFVMGQDVTLVLAALAVAMSLFFRGRHFTAGCVLALCTIKFHLFLTLPLLILVRRQWRLGTGAVAGGAVLAAASFAVQGWRWPLDYVHMLRLPTSTPSFNLMPNLNGLLSGHPHGAGATAAAAAVVLVAATVVMWRGKFTIALAAALLSGLLLSYHAFIADAMLLLPAGLLLLRDKSSRAHRPVGLILLSPLAFLGFRLEHVPYPPAAIVLAPLLVMAGAAIPAARQSSLRRRLPAAAPGRT